ncbi:putative transcriptional regulator [Agromyces flavus]|uniref:Transcriptional regulator n=1 Tax=Agromyces flavus TaxID=589382 RepID=A0A1H1ZP57_9MICO|nr:hypothetical protein [Agromyces flavus]MCP2367191.1 putative transcriptional regulator [Agromyces flavus]GGI46219.1 hypothetical protein GCM10010932_13500 [Agromyces flavus]SDT35484.1 hypothetical protein SAMN04489721_3270 [Agromyces flavus]
MDEWVTTVKVDRETHRLIGDLAHLLGRSRKDVVRDAVLAFAAWRERMLDDGLDAAVHRIAAASQKHEMRAAAGGLDVTSAERVERSRIGAARMSPRVEAALSPAELLEHHRPEIEAAFERLGASEPRFAIDPRRYGHLAEHRVIVVDLVDPARFEKTRLQAAAFDIMAMHWFVVPAEWATPG